MDHAIWFGFAKAFAINLFDEDRQGSFPGFLLVVGEGAELAGI